MPKLVPAQNRSFMFVPGNKPRFLEKALGCDAHVVFFDLEDGVLPAEKPEGRRMTREVLGAPAGGPRRYVRVNDRATPWLKEDLEAVVQPGLEGIALTKVASAEDIHETSQMLEQLERDRRLEVGHTAIVAAIESARGLVNAVSIADAGPRVVGLMFGAEDYALDLNLGTSRVKEAADLLYARSALVVAATAAGILSIDGVYPNLDDPEGLIADTWQSRRLGFTSKSTFNPRQIDIINDIYSPQPEEIEYARQIAVGFREAEARGDASVAVGGQLVDKPIVLRALQLLEAAGETI
ncbi:HpcH/HpaI aldolase/citrate lyase family protein [Croceicoccus sediminis]|uniref:HpcH/HpaI aldolase/citrate lyase family protein n=1 Tax=Croceicoccus sediminis TaxID=2571150 RepID=UPI0011828130|nr:CoA ester lyase [Croceicoccus sediminis]